MVPGTMLISLLVKGVQLLLNFSFIFGYFLTYSTYMMGTLRTSTNVRVLTVVLPALLAGWRY